jgi:hypothetical protein
MIPISFRLPSSGLGQLQLCKWLRVAVAGRGRTADFLIPRPHPLFRGRIYQYLHLQLTHILESRGEAIPKIWR